MHGNVLKAPPPMADRPSNRTSGGTASAGETDTGPSDPLPDLSPDIQVLRLADRDATLRRATGSDDARVHDWLVNDLSFALNMPPVLDATARADRALRRGLGDVRYRSAGYAGRHARRPDGRRPLGGARQPAPGRRAGCRRPRPRCRPAPRRAAAQRLSAPDAGAGRPAQPGPRPQPHRPPRPRCRGCTTRRTGRSLPHGSHLPHRSAPAQRKIVEENAETMS